ncbi:MAG TPA: sensor histidine kinase [Chitinophagaceae bacterium]|nr:sensor histidine kinase [Chitinophagaceae bacterium]
MRSPFLFSDRYRLARHVLYWLLHICIWAIFWKVVGVSVSYARMVLNMTMWVPLFIFFCYPLIYFAIPQLLLKGRILGFLLVILSWGGAGLYFDVAYREYIYIPLQQWMGLSNILPGGPIAFCFLCMTTSAVGPVVLRFFKLLSIKQEEIIKVQEERSTAELQWLKSQIHPHFLFNTLNNIYSYALSHSAKTPALVQKLSSLMHYMMYDCKAEEVDLSTEIQIIQNYIDLEKERYGDRISISMNVSGNMKGVKIAPLLLLPFLENAFKHGLSEQIDIPELIVDISMDQGLVSCVIANSKNIFVHSSTEGIGIHNVRNRLELIYPGRHVLKIQNDAHRFTVFMQVKLDHVYVMQMKTKALSHTTM